MLKPVLERFLDNISISPSGCWEWTASLFPLGYGQFYANKKRTSCHRFIYEYYYGNIYPKLTIDHLCRNRKCCNPIHLEQVTLQENLQRGNTQAAINSQKTHCKRGHEYTKENTYFMASDNSRNCRECQRLRSRKHYWSHKLIIPVRKKR